jgi:cell division protein FtsL
MNTNYDFADFSSNNTFAAEGSSESSGTREMSPVEKGCLIAATAATVAVAGALVYGSVKTFKYL